MSWEKLYGPHVLISIRRDVRHPFCDADGICFQLDGMTVFAFENPDDGYRSSCASPMIAECSMYEFGVSPNYIRAPVIIREWTRDDYYTCDGIEMIDTRNGRTILRVGTANTDDYYPFFECKWNPENLADNEGK